MAFAALRFCERLKMFGLRDLCFILTADYADYTDFGWRDHGFFLWARLPQMVDRRRSISTDYASPNGMDTIRHIHSRGADKDVMADLLICDCLEHFRYLRIDLADENYYRFYEMNLRGEQPELLFERKRKPTDENMGKE